MTENIETASFGRRLLAVIIDVIIFAPIGLLLLYLVVGGEQFSVIMNNSDPFYITQEQVIIDYILPIIITILLWIKFSGTPGKLILQCKIVDAESHGKLSVQQAVIRYFAYFISTIPLCLGFLWMLWDKKGQTWHDKISKTLVIREQEADILPSDDDYKNFKA